MQAKVCTEADGSFRPCSPGAMALGAAGSPDLAERVSEASAKELKLVGMNWAYSPVADVNSDPRNPVIGLFMFTCHCDVL
jgi:beta-glucosidase-like glycosyl hydrolase